MHPQLKGISNTGNIIKFHVKVDVVFKVEIELNKGAFKSFQFEHKGRFTKSYDMKEENKRNEKEIIKAMCKDITCYFRELRYENKGIPRLFEAILESI